MAVATLPQPYRPAGAAPRPDGLARTFRAVARLLRQPGCGRNLGLALLGVALAFLVVALFEAGAAAPAPRAPAPTRPRQWVDIVRPSPVFALESPEFGKEPSLYAARRHASGGGRQDILTFGRFDGGATPYLHLSLYRIGSGTASSATFFVELARRAAEAGLAVTRSDQPAPLATRFGDFEVVDVVLARGPAQAACLGFRFHAENPGFRVVGFACGGAGKPLEKTVLACALDRLDLVSAAADRNLGQFFAAARPERDRSCGGGLTAARPARQDLPRKAVQNLKSTDHMKKASR
jgi:hypothetical protein